MSKHQITIQFTNLLVLMQSAKLTLGTNDAALAMEKLAKEAVKKYGKEIINFVDKDGNNLAHYAVRFTSCDLLEYLIEQQVDIDKRNINGQTPFDLALRATVNDNDFTDYDHMASSLIKAGAKFNFDKPEIFKVLMNILSDKKYHHQTADIIFFETEDEQRNSIVKAVDAVVFLKWCYTNFGHLIGAFKATELLTKFGSRSEAQKENNAVFLQALEIMRAKDLVDVGDKKISVMQLPYNGHVAYLVIEWNKDNQPLQVFYCDSYCALACKNDKRYNYGAVGFTIDDRDLSKQEIEKQAQERFKNMDYDISKMEDSDLVEIFESLKEIFHIPFHNRSHILQEIPTVPQAANRSICAMKSSKIAMRLIAKLISQKEYSLDEKTFEPRGELYDQYKVFMRGAIDAAIDDFAEVVQDPNLPCFEAVLEYAEGFIKTAKRKAFNRDEVKGGENSVNLQRLEKLQSCLEKSEKSKKPASDAIPAGSAAAIQKDLYPVV